MGSGVARFKVGGAFCGQSGSVQSNGSEARQNHPGRGGRGGRSGGERRGGWACTWSGSDAPLLTVDEFASQNGGGSPSDVNAIGGHPNEEDTTAFGGLVGYELLLAEPPAPVRPQTGVC